MIHIDDFDNKIDKYIDEHIDEIYEELLANGATFEDISENEILNDSEFEFIEIEDDFVEIKNTYSSNDIISAITKALESISTSDTNLIDYYNQLIQSSVKKYPSKEEKNKVELSQTILTDTSKNIHQENTAIKENAGKDFVLAA